MSSFIHNILGKSSDKKELKKSKVIIDLTAKYSAEASELENYQFAEKTAELKAEYQAKIANLKNEKEKEKALDSLMPKAFAYFREASQRITGMRPFDVQLIGAYIMNRGNIAEMKTGEGKSLTAAMAAYSRTISGEPVHIITVNEYLAIRDAEYFKELFDVLGVTVSFNISTLTSNQKRNAYQADIVYSTNSEIGFDYLRDNMVKSANSRVQRGLKFAIVDEADSVLIDEGRTPLIISGNARDVSIGVKKADAFVKSLNGNDYIVNREERSVVLTASGVEKGNRYYGVDNLYEAENVDVLQLVQKSLYANYYMKNGIEYVVQKGEIQIVDVSTGRILEGRSFSDGLHQAIEAKENVEITEENNTVATITYQNLFRLYDKLSGMTGTAKTEEEEFVETYNMFVIEVPTNRPVVREYSQKDDLLFVSRNAKHMAIIEEIKEANKKGQPVLIGTGSVEESEELHIKLQNAGIDHQLLNATNHANEAKIIENAGQKGAVTLATNMAGRGTDIKLGEGIAQIGGLYVIGAERHESRRIDNQLIGRSARQGDPGKARFFISVEDKIFELQTRMIRAQITNLAKMNEAGVSHPSLVRLVKQAQIALEGQNFDSRKELLKYDGILKEQREVVYGIRNTVLDQGDLEEFIKQAIKNVSFQALSAGHIEDSGRSKIKINLETVNQFLTNNLKLEITELGSKVNTKKAAELISNTITDKYNELNQKYGSTWDVLKREFILNEIDEEWQKQIDYMASLRESVSLLGYAQEDPLVVYQKRGFVAFNDMMEIIYLNVVKKLIGGIN